jgi:hypothetical protein
MIRKFSFGMGRRCSRCSLQVSRDAFRPPGIYLGESPVLRSVPTLPQFLLRNTCAPRDSITTFSLLYPVASAAFFTDDVMELWSAAELEQ